jgi:hypothetical protein
MDHTKYKNAFTGKLVRTFGTLKCATLNVINIVSLHVEGLTFAELPVNISSGTAVPLEILTGTSTASQLVSPGG